MQFTYNEHLYGLEGMWDSGSEQAIVDFSYRERESYEHLTATRREAHLRQLIPGVSISFVNLEQDLQDDPEDLLVPHTKLCVIEWHQAIPYIPAEYDQVLSAAGYIRMFRFPTQEDYYESKVMGELHKATRLITNYYLTAMVRQQPLPKTSGPDPTTVS